MPECAKYLDLAGKNVFITGGASGIGEALVRGFIRQDARVCFIDIDERSANELLQSLPEEADATFMHCDITNSDRLEEVVKNTSKQYGGIQVLINNAANDQRQNLDEVNLQSWNQSLAVNLTPSFLLAKLVAPEMKEAGEGSIINFSSINALFGPQNLMAYNTAKAGLLGLTKSLARELGPFGVRVNSILPGWVVTEKQLAQWLTPEVEAEWMESVCLKKRIMPEDVANLALFLASNSSSMITSQNLIIDGGRL